MRLLVSVRCENAFVQAEQSEGLARVVASITEAAVQIHADEVYIVFDASLGEVIEVCRQAVAVPPQRTRVWGGVGEVSEPILDLQDVRAMRLRRCLAEVEPEAIIDIFFGEAAGISGPLLSMLPHIAVTRDALISEALVTIHADSSEGLGGLLTRWGTEIASTGVDGHAPARAVAESVARKVGQLELDASQIGERAGEVYGQGCHGEFVPDIVDLDPGLELDDAISRLVKEERYVRSRSGKPRVQPDQLSLDTTLQLAYACGGYASLRGALIGEELPEAEIEAWLSSVSRGARAVIQDDCWHDVRITLDAALAQCLGDALAAPAVVAALRSDILGAVAGPRRLLVDISALVKFDAKSGIQRVVRNILTYLEEALPERYQVAPIAFMDDGRCLHASRFYARFVGLPYDVPDDAMFTPRPGDIFLGLDLSAHIVPVYRTKFEWMRRLGIPIHFVVYDLLPLRRSECFDPRVVELFRAWYASVADLADGVLCISRAVADEFAEWLDEHRPRRIGPLDIGYFHLGADIIDAKHQAAGTAHPVGGRRYALMVSTLEPRKGYAQALAAFEVLWARGIDLALVIVGKQGWMMEALVERLREHPELGRRLHWFEGIDDVLLARLYGHADVLLSASEGEGFGLPLIEAAQYGVPVLCRDLPVFREIAGDAASYFNGYEPEALADAVEHWLGTKDARRVGQISWKTWREATIEFVSAFTADQPYRRWIESAGNHHVFSGYNSRLHTLVGERSHGDIVTTGREGALVYGPYAALSAGSYRLFVHGEMPDGQTETMLVEVVAVQASFQAAAWHVKAAKCGLLVAGEFHLVRDVDDLEVRLMVSAAHVARISKIEIIRDRPGSDTISTTQKQGNSEERVQ